MSKLLTSLSAVQAAVDVLARKNGVPGAALGVLDGEDVVTIVTGVASKRTGVEVTPDTMFQIGSNTKIYTTTLLMQLVDEGQGGLGRSCPKVRAGAKACRPQSTGDYHAAPSAQP